MKAAIYYGKNDIRVEERPIPAVGATDVLVRNLRGGICGTDINIVKAGASNMGISLGSFRLLPFIKRMCLSVLHK